MEIRKEIREYIESEIFKQNSLNESGHGIEHIEYVIGRSLEFAKQVEDINIEMVYVIAAYHDIGHHIDAKNHEKVSAKILEDDEKLKEFFNENQIKIMKEAVEDHRSSSKEEPRSIYGKIVSSADRNTSVKATLKRAYSYRKKHSPQLTKEEILEESRVFLIKKFGLNGYARDKMFFDDKLYTKYLDDITELTSNKQEFYKKMIEVNNLKSE